MTDDNGALLASLGEGQNREPSAVTDGLRGDAASTTPSVPSGTDARQQLTLPLFPSAEPLPPGTYAGADLALTADTWQADGYVRLGETLAGSGEPFTADTLRSIGGDPSSDKVLGAVFATLSRRGVIRPLHVAPSARRERRGGLRRVWVGTDEFVGSFRTADREAVG